MVFFLLRTQGVIEVEEVNTSGYVRMSIELRYDVWNVFVAT